MYPLSMVKEYPNGNVKVNVPKDITKSIRIEGNKDINILRLFFISNGNSPNRKYPIMKDAIANIQKRLFPSKKPPAVIWVALSIIIVFGSDKLVRFDRLLGI